MTSSRSVTISKNLLNHEFMRKAEVFRIFLFNMYKSALIVNNSHINFGRYAMKVIAIVLICLVLIIVGVYAVKVNNKASDEETYLRIHIRANSNDAIDQSVKYKVRESIVDFMTPALENVSSKSEAMQILQDNIVAMKVVADNTLARNGYEYTSKVSLRKEEFPARTYGDLTLDCGVYDALIIELGRGEGDNWWCVVFPPLCFVGENKNNVEYKSYFAQLYHKIAGK